MIQYKDYRPFQFDSKGLALPDRQDWFVLPIGRNRDSGPLDESNFFSALKMLGGEGDDVEVHSFGHWACGWFEIILIRPESSQQNEGEDIENFIDDYPIIDEEDFSLRETEANLLTWQNCYNNQDRIDFIRKRHSEFEFHSFADMLGCCHGTFYNGPTIYE